MFTALLYHNDSALRPTPSKHAFTIMNDAEYSMVYNIMLDLHVPAFAANEFEALRYYSDDLAVNLASAGTLAASDFLRDFGRLIPATAFFRMHNLMINLPGNTPVTKLRHEYSRLPIIEMPVNGHLLDITPGHLFGYLRTSANTHNVYNNWITTNLNFILSQSSLRNLSNRPNSGMLPLDTPSFADLDDFNPYLFAIGLIPENTASLMSLFRNLDHFVKSVYPTSKPLRTYTQVGNIEIFRHLIFESPAPTWHTDANTLPEYDENTSPFRPAAQPRSHYRFAQDIHFKIAKADIPATATPANNFRNVGPHPNPAQGNSPPLYDSEQNCPPAGTSQTSLWSTLDQRNDIIAPAIIFDPTSNASAHLAAVITSGKIIETYDLKGIIINLPSPIGNLFWLNAEYITGAIPAHKIRLATTNNPVHVLKTDPNADQNHVLAFIKGKFGQLTLPWFRQGTIELAPTSQGQSNQQFFGAHLLEHAQRASDSINYIGTRLDTDPAIPDESIHLWSSYTIQNQANQVHYWLPSLRHLFGVRARLSRTEHPSRRIP
jgi:hypothetical protein